MGFQLTITWNSKYPLYHVAHMQQINHPSWLVSCIYQTPQGNSNHQPCNHDQLVISNDVRTHDITTNGVLFNDVITVDVMSSHAMFNGVTNNVVIFNHMISWDGVLFNDVRTNMPIEILLTLSRHLVWVYSPQPTGLLAADWTWRRSTAPAQYHPGETCRVRPTAIPLLRLLSMFTTKLLLISYTVHILLWAAFTLTVHINAL